MRLTKLLILLLLLSLNGIGQTSITSDVTINQNWINNNSTGPWTISTSSVTVTFGENLTISSTTQYFIITGTNVTINGAGKAVTISGVPSYPGLVDAISSNARSAIIKNIGVVTQNSSTLSDLNGWISKTSNKATISNCYSTGPISGFGSGGIVGDLNSGAISNCYTTGPILGFFSGGIVGASNFGTISNCYSAGTISGMAEGIAGFFNTVAIPNNYIGNGNWDPTAADAKLTGLTGSGKIWNTSNTPYTLMSFLLSELTITSPSGTLTSNCAGVPSESKSFGVNGSGLSTPVIILAPSNFEVSTSSDGSYSSSLTLPQASTVSQTVYIRLSSAATTNGANGTITANSSSLTPATTTVSSTTVSAPIFSVTGPYTICSEGTYAVSLTVGNSYNGWSVSSNAITVNSSGYVTAGTVTGTYSVSYSDACAQTTSATVTVASTSTLPAITDGLASYKFNNNPQGPIGSGNVIYMGYNGFNYSSTTRPTKPGFYRANNVSGSNAGSPFEYDIFRCTTCGTVSSFGTRPQGTLSGNTSGTGQLTYTSSNGGGPFTIVYQATGASPVTVNNISSTVAFNVVTPTITTSYKLISVTDESTNASTDFSGSTASITLPLRIGDSYQGGKIFYIDGTGQHGLIAATADQSTEIQWYNGNFTTGATATAIGTGLANTTAIISSQINTGSYAAKLCADYSLTVDGFTYTDWYLPSKDELNQLYLNRDAIGVFARFYYWSSTESGDFYAWSQDFSNGGQVNYDVFNAFFVRAIRKF